MTKKKVAKAIHGPAAPDASQSAPSASSGATTPAELPPNGRKLVEGEAPRADRQAAHPNLLPPYQKGENSRTSEPTRRGPDRKPRQVARLGFTRALVAVQMRDGKPISGFEDMTLALRRIYANDNHRYFLGVVTLTKEIFDDAPDSGSGRTTIFMFPSEVEAEMNAAGQPQPAGERKAPDAPSGPLAGMEEVEEP